MAGVAVFTYGSNLCSARLEARVGHVHVVATGVLEGHDLRFHKLGRDGSGKADAYFTGRRSVRVWGAIYDLSPDQKRELDRFEGVGSQYDESTVEIGLEGGRRVSAVVYRALASRIKDGLVPFDWYLAFVLAGAREHVLPAEYVGRIGRVASHADPDRGRHESETRVLESFLRRA